MASLLNLYIGNTASNLGLASQYLDVLIIIYLDIKLVLRRRSN